MMNRRQFLTRTGMGMGALSLGALAESPLAAHAPHFAPKAKRVIHFFLNGGPSHVDTFDPKPMLAKYAGQPLPGEYLRTERKTGAAFPSPFTFQKYGQSGLEVSELFSKTAAHADSIAVVRSMYAQVPNHEPSLMLMNCGDSVQARPSFGSWLLYGLGSENQNLPGFVAMCPGGMPIKDSENWQAGFLPGALQGTFVDPQHRELDKLIENIRSPHASTAIQRRQLDLLRDLNAAHQRTHSDPRLESLIARRLLERGVRFVQLWHGAGQPWDHHSNIKDNIRKHSGEIDGPIAALIADLKKRGMFEDTLILWGGEFGRTPTVELGDAGKSQLGRDHNHYGFSVWMTGGGIKGGIVHGATDEFGFKAVEKRASVHDLHATMLHLLGFDHERLTYRHAGRDFRLTDVSGDVMHDILA